MRRTVVVLLPHSPGRTAMPGSVMTVHAPRCRAVPAQRQPWTAPRCIAALQLGDSRASPRADGRCWRTVLNPIAPAAELGRVICGIRRDGNICRPSSAGYRDGRAARSTAQRCPVVGHPGSTSPPSSARPPAPYITDRRAGKPAPPGSPGPGTNKPARKLSSGTEITHRELHPCSAKAPSCSRICDDL
jgi:hypothetical protein